MPPDLLKSKTDVDGLQMYKQLTYKVKVLKKEGVTYWLQINYGEFYG